MIEQISAMILKDGYKVDHRSQFIKGTEYVYNNFCPRSKRGGNNDEKVVVVGLQYVILEYLIDRWNKTFFQLPKEVAVLKYKRIIDSYIGEDKITYKHVSDLHDLGYLPIRIKALPEGTFIKHGIPTFTCVNTVEGYGWLSQMIETLLSCTSWKTSTSATTAFQFRKRLEEHAIKTGYDRSFVKWQGHDFSFRGDSFLEDAILNGFAHLCLFFGSDTIPSIEFAEIFYGANCETELVAGTVPATEHSVMCVGTSFEGELNTFKRLITETYPEGPVSIVSDTNDFWKVITDFLPALKDIILSRNGRVIIRPDSGNPVRIICGYREDEIIRQDGKIYIKEGEGSSINSEGKVFDGGWHKGKELTEIEVRGAWKALCDIFGTTISPTGYKLLDTHIGLIYGDAINLQREDEILTHLEEDGYAYNNGVFGMGSYLYQFTTRDVHRWAIKATWSQINGEPFELSKDPKTDSGFKKSLKGLLMVYEENGEIKVKDQCTLEEEQSGLLETVFLDGELYRCSTLEEIRALIEKNLQIELGIL